MPQMSNFSFPFLHQSLLSAKFLPILKNFLFAMIFTKGSDYSGLTSCPKCFCFLQLQEVKKTFLVNLFYNAVFYF
jgi:hypothetical protein